MEPPEGPVEEPPEEPPGHAWSGSGFHLARWGFIKGLGGLYLIVFVSLWRQLGGLIGPRGLAPAQDGLDWLAGHYGPWERLFEVPTIFWALGASSQTLEAVALVGALAGALALVGVAPIAAMAVAWVCMLSIVTVGGPFLSFQWDGLMLEVGFLAIFLSPWGLWPRLSQSSSPPKWLWWVVWGVLVRLMFSSGYVKLASGDPTWRTLTALDHHFQTQPLPTWLAWYAHQLPDWLKQASVAGMFAVELAVPWLAFGPRKARLAACGLMVALQLALMATGNFAHFTLLTILLCFTLLDDRTLAPLIPPHHPLSPPRETTARPWRARSLKGLAVALATLAVVQQGATLVGPRNLPEMARKGLGAISQLHLVNRYGVFAVMTTRRPEVVIEGSMWGFEWEEYTFAHKPGSLRRAPRFVAPHQPRLDWQMWFAALQGCERSPWLHTLMRRIIEGEPEVMGLLERDPFEGLRPRHVRAVLYEYHFADPEQRDLAGWWWTRRVHGLYCPVMSLPKDKNIPEFEGL